MTPIEMKPIKNKLYRICFLDKSVPDFCWFKGYALCVNDKADALITAEDGGTPNYEFVTLKEDGTVGDQECYFPAWAIIGEAPFRCGIILVHSIGSGCDTFYSVTKVASKSIQVRELQYLVVDAKPRIQTHKIQPLPKYAKDSKEIRLRVHADGSIGPAKRLMWWRVWDGKEREQWSP